jgi:hypothetical protein
MPVARKKPHPKTDEWVSLQRAAQELGEVRQTVLARAVAGELDGKAVAGRTVISRKSLNRLLAQRAK